MSIADIISWECKKWPITGRGVKHRSSVTIQVVVRSQNSGDRMIATTTGFADFEAWQKTRLLLPQTFRVRFRGHSGF
jgi:hypothetical protein